MRSKNIIQTAVIFALMVASLGIMATLAYNRLKSLIAHTEVVNRNAEFVQKLEEVLSQLKDGEVGSRGYMVTHDTAFLEPYNNAKRNMETNLIQLFTAAADRNRQQKSLDSVRRMAYEKLGMCAYSMFKTEENSEFRLLAMQHGKVKMDSIRGLIGRLKMQQVTLLQLQKNEQGSLAAVSPTYILMMIVAAFGIILTAVYIIVRQIYELIRNQKMLELKVAELAHTNRELDLYAFTLTHDLQEPLRKIRLFMSRFESKNRTLFVENVDNKAISKKINDLAVEGQDKLSQFMQFARLTQRTEHDRQQVDLNAILESVLLEKKSLIALKSATIKCDKLPTINGNAEQLHLLFAHLLDNALKFSEPSRPLSICIENQVSEEPKYIRICIRDNGIGIEEIYQKQIFDIFTRLHEREHFDGLGVGLAVCRRIVELHGGSIYVTSKAGEGCLFEVRLPR